MQKMKYHVYVCFKSGQFVVIDSNSRNSKKHLMEHSADKVYIVKNGDTEIISYAAVLDDSDILVCGASKRG